MLKITLKVQERDDVAPSYHVAPRGAGGGTEWNEIIRDGDWVICQNFSSDRIEFPAHVVASLRYEH